MNTAYLQTKKKKQANKKILKEVSNLKEEFP